METQIKQELARVARYHALSYIRWYICLILLAASFYSLAKRFPLWPFFFLSIYLLLSVGIHGILSGRLSEPKKGSSKTAPLLLPFFCKRYHFTYIRYLTQTISFVLFCFLMFWWNSMMKNRPWNNFLLNHLPLFLLASATSGFVFLSLFFRNRFRHHFMNGNYL